MEGFVGETVTIVADLPGQGAAVVTVTDALGRVVADRVPATALGGPRVVVTVPGEQVTVPGLWEAVFTRGSTVRKVQILIGNDAPLKLSLVDLLLQVASQETPPIEGTLEAVSSDGLIVTDTALPGDVDTWVGKHLVLHPEDDLANGLVSRVVAASSGGSLTLVSPFPTPVSPGTRYALLEVPPRELLRALTAAIAEYSSLARLRLDAVNLPVTMVAGEDRGEVSIPAGFTHVYEVLAGDGMLPDDAWSPAPGRRLLVPAGVTQVTVRGLAPLLPPSQPHSVLTVEPTALISLAAMHLHAARSRGAGLDVEEHLRRLMVALQIADGSLHRLAGRVPHGAVAVLP